MSFRGICSKDLDDTTLRHFEGDRISTRTKDVLPINLYLFFMGSKGRHQILSNLKQDSNREARSVFSNSKVRSSFLKATPSKILDHTYKKEYILTRGIFTKRSKHQRLSFKKPLTSHQIYCKTVLIILHSKNMSLSTLESQEEAQISYTGREESRNTQLYSQSWKIKSLIFIDKNGIIPQNVFQLDNGLFSVYLNYFKVP